MKINALGLENSMRTKKDGIIYFGFQEDLKNVKFVIKNIFNFSAGGRLLDKTKRSRVRQPLHRTALPNLLQPRIYEVLS